MLDSVLQYLRKKYVTLAYKCDYKGSRAAAIRMVCLHCMGGESDAASSIRDCTLYDCPNWQFRFGIGVEKRPDGYVPTQEEYLAKIKLKSSDKRAENAKKLSSLKKESK